MAEAEVSVAAEIEDLESNAVACDCLSAHDEEETSQYGLGDKVKDDEKRSSHGSEGQEPLREVANALLDHMVDDSGGFGGIVLVGNLSSYTKTICMKWSLRD